MSGKILGFFICTIIWESWLGNAPSPLIFCNQMEADKNDATGFVTPNSSTSWNTDLCGTEENVLKSTQLQ